jgi:hypothetical protein
MDIAGSEQIILNLIQFLLFQMDQHEKGSTVLNVERDFKVEHTGEPRYNAKVGPYNVGKIHPEKEREQVSILKQVLSDFESDVINWEKSQELKSMHAELNSLKKSITEELAVLILRRVVSGRCKYCPL